MLARRCPPRSLAASRARSHEARREPSTVAAACGRPCPRPHDARGRGRLSADADVARRKERVPEAGSSVVPNGIPLRAFHADATRAPASRELGIPDGRVRRRLGRRLADEEGLPTLVARRRACCFGARAPGPRGRRRRARRDRARGSRPARRARRARPAPGATSRRCSLLRSLCLPRATRACRSPSPGDGTGCRLWRRRSGACRASLPAECGILVPPGDEAARDRPMGPNSHATPMRRAPHGRGRPRRGARRSQSSGWPTPTRHLSRL